MPNARLGCCIPPFDASCAAVDAAPNTGGEARGVADAFVWPNNGVVFAAEGADDVAGADEPKTNPPPPEPAAASPVAAAGFPNSVGAVVVVVVVVVAPNVNCDVGAAGAVLEKLNAGFGASGPDLFALLSLSFATSCVVVVVVVAPPKVKACPVAGVELAAPNEKAGFAAAGFSVSAAVGGGAGVTDPPATEAFVVAADEKNGEGAADADADAAWKSDAASGAFVTSDAPAIGFTVSVRVSVAVGEAAREVAGVDATVFFSKGAVGGGAGCS